MTPAERRRRRERKYALCALYAADVSGGDVDEVFASLPEAISWHLGNAGCSDGFGLALCAGVVEHADELDSWIADVAENWSVERMPVIDRALLRMALYEILWHDEIPPAVTIDEAVELAKCYSTTDSSRFVNGMLGRLTERADTARRAGKS